MSTSPLDDNAIQDLVRDLKIASDITNSATGKRGDAVDPNSPVLASVFTEVRLITRSTTGPYAPTLIWNDAPIEVR